MKANIRGTEIFFDIAGTQVVPTTHGLVEKPVLFLIHGGPGGNHIPFKHHSIKLQEYAQLVFIDQRGCGWSKKGKKEDHTLENNIEDIEALRKYLGLNKICILGASYGGIVAQGYAIRYSKNIDKLILVVTTPSYHFIDEAKNTLKKIGNSKQISICDKYLWQGAFPTDKSIDSYFNVMESLYSYHHKKSKPKITSKKRNQLKDIWSLDAINAGFSGFLRHFNFIPKLKKITCPTLVLAGQYDWICSPAQSRIIADNIPNAKLKIFRKCGHALARDVNDKYIREIKRFLK